MTGIRHLLYGALASLGVAPAIWAFSAWGPLVLAPLLAGVLLVALVSARSARAKAGIERIERGHLKTKEFRRNLGGGESTSAWTPDMMPVFAAGSEALAERIFVCGECAYFYCRERGVSYCGEQWDDFENDDWFDCTPGRCPRGHTRTLVDGSRRRGYVDWRSAGARGARAVFLWRIALFTKCRSFNGLL